MFYLIFNKELPPISYLSESNRPNLVSTNDSKKEIFDDANVAETLLKTISCNGEMNYLKIFGYRK